MSEPTEDPAQPDELHPDEAAVLEGATADDTDPEPEPEPEDDTEPEPEPEQPKGLSEKQIEGIYKRLDKAAAGYMNAVQGVIEGHDLGLDTCPLCAYPGLVFPYAGDASDDVIKRQLTETYFGVVKEDYPADDKWVACVKCDGTGKRSRPTKVESARVIMCEDCNGQGCREKAAMEAQNAVYQFPMTVTAGSTTYGTTAGTPDEWGRPPGHPHYGIHPAAAGLSA